jgi:Fe-S-cluster containining protein
MLNYESKDLLTANISKVDEVMASFDNVTEAKTFSKSEMKEYRGQLLSFYNALGKCGVGHIIPPEFKSVVREFEKADYDISKLGKNLKVSLDHTYNDLSKLLKTNPKEFEKLQYLHRFYTYLKVIGKDDIGLIFECYILDPETHKCKIHKSRPGICRRYPQEELFSMGGALSDDCGYKMEPIIPFAEVLEKTKCPKSLSHIR